MSEFRRSLEAADLGDHRTASKIVPFTQRDNAFFEDPQPARRKSQFRRILEAADLGDHRTASKVVPFTQRDKAFFEDPQPASKTEQNPKGPRGC